MLGDVVAVGYIGDYLTLGGVGFIAGVALPFAARIAGYVVDTVRKFVR